MRILLNLYSRSVGLVSGRWTEALILCLVRLSLAGVFWRSGRSKVVEGSWIQISDGARYLFETDYSAVPLPPDLAAHLALVSETVFPILLALGLFTRLSALALFGMTLVIQIFVFPDAFWSTHSLWFALAGVLVVRGGGLLSVDKLLASAIRA